MGREVKRGREGKRGRGRGEGRGTSARRVMLCKIFQGISTCAGTCTVNHFKNILRY